MSFWRSVEMTHRSVSARSRHDCFTVRRAARRRETKVAVPSVSATTLATFRDGWKTVTKQMRDNGCAADGGRRLQVFARPTVDSAQLTPSPLIFLQGCG
jgi:uncharacterized protein (DUF2252 family)